MRASERSKYNDTDKSEYKSVISDQASPADENRNNPNILNANPNEVFGAARITRNNTNLSGARAFKITEGQYDTTDSKHRFIDDDYNVGSARRHGGDSNRA